jgi:F-type H+-transporting ATPase subunit gamma
METLETLARRMQTAEELRDLVRTMKSLAAVSIRQYERSIAALTDYDHTVELGLRAALRDEPPPRPPRARRSGTAGRTGVLVLGSDQGLCGTFNEQVVGRVLEDVQRGPLLPAGLRLLAVGERVASRLGEAGLVPEEQVGVAASAASLPALVQDLLLVLDGWRSGGDLTDVLLYYNRPMGTTASRPHRQQLLPISAERLEHLRSTPWPTRMVPRRTVDRPVLLGAIARHALFVTLHRALAWSAASEQASRLLAMQAAERNIDERLEELRGAYHTRRQTTITTEVLDIVSGAEAASA